MKMLTILLLYLLTITHLQLSLASEPPSLVMGYKEGSKPPYIGPAGDNNGAYLELFTLAANRIGFQLKVIRLPKKRVYQQLAQGKIDFYPSSGFSHERKEYLYWFPNGLLSKQALLSNNMIQDITEFSQIKGTLLAPLGSSAANYAIKNPAIKIQKMGVLPLDKAILAMKLGRGDFYIYDLDTLDYYLKRKGLLNFEQISLKLHPNAIDKEFSSLQGSFSIHSKYFQAEKNPNYNPNKKADFDNQQLTPSKNSIAYAFEQALAHLQETGKTKEIYNKYFK